MQDKFKFEWSSNLNKTKDLWKEYDLKEQYKSKGVSKFEWSSIWKAEQKESKCIMTIFMQVFKMHTS